MEHIRMIRVMQETARKSLAKGQSIGLVPTMGALHDGHLSLIKSAKNENDIVVVSIFVNPLQFGKNEDFDKYPRDLEADKAKLQNLGVDIIFAPETKTMYADGFATIVTVKDISQKLCGLFRPSHFDGVATVVTKLFNIVLPTRAYFGQKDYQQTLIIKRITEDLNFKTQIVVCPTVREPDGLAMSSRNSYLTSLQRQQAPIIFNTLKKIAHRLRQKTEPIATLSNEMFAHLSSAPGITTVQYAGIFDPETLQQSTDYNKVHLLAVAVMMGDTRLIDNMIVEL